MTDTDMKPLALVTGASSGIGFELAKQFAEHDFDLLVTAHDEDRLAAAAAELRSLGAGVGAFQVDLRRYEGVEELYAAVRDVGRPLSAAALNAGVGVGGGTFLETDLDDELGLIALNVTSTVHLAKRLLADMAARDEGRVLITSSIAATMPGSYQAVYNASKSFLQSFAEALQSELNGTGVQLTALMPGPTDTDFFRRAHMQDTEVGQALKDDPAQVAKQGFHALMAGDDKIVAGSVKTKVMGLANRVIPDKVKAAVHREMAQPKDD